MWASATDASNTPGPGQYMVSTGISQPDIRAFSCLWLHKMVLESLSWWMQYGMLCGSVARSSWHHLLEECMRACKQYGFYICAHAMLFVEQWCLS
jgi:hypothetical protein